jgi:hypothetical protein
VIAGGTVQDGGAAGITSLTVSAASTTVNAGATLDFNDSSNQAIHNLQGNGSVVTGTVGGTTLTLFADPSASSTFGGVISGPGAVQYETTGFGGTIILTGANTYTGGTFICSCTTLQLGDATHTGSIVGVVTNEGLFSIVNANTSGITSIINQNGGETDFLNSSSAGSAHITNHAGATVFGTPGSTDTSTAGKATINNNDGATAFYAMTNAGTADITNRNGGITEFVEHSNAGSAPPS